MKQLLSNINWMPILGMAICVVGASCTAAGLVWMWAL